MQEANDTEVDCPSGLASNSAERRASESVKWLAGTTRSENMTILKKDDQNQ